MKANQTVNKANKKLIVLLLSVITLLCFVFSVAIYHDGKADTATLTGVEFAESYTIGTELDLPDGTVTVGNDEYSAEPIIYYPDGSAYAVSKATLSQKGKYTVEYSVQVSGKIYSVKKNFVVSEFLFSNSATDAPFKYLTNDQYYHEIVNDEPDYYQGVHFEIKTGEKLLYNKAIDLSDNTKNDTLVSFDAIPEVSGERDAETLMFVFTDLYDSNIYLTIRVRRAPKDDGATHELWSYIAASHNGQPLTGTDGKYFFQGSDVYGYGVKNGLAGGLHYEGEHAGDHGIIDLRYDNAEKAVYAYYEPNNESNKLTIVTNLVNDFSAKPFDGFTTGEVMMSVYATDWATSDTERPFHGIIFDVDGHDLKAGIADDGTVGATTVTTAPVPVVDFGEFGNANGIPKAMVGYGYKIFDANFDSMHGGEILTTRVFYGYNTSTRYELNVKDGRFIPDLEGVYNIVYKVTDIFGNSQEVIVDVEAIKYSAEKIGVTVPGYDEYLDCMVGEDFTIVGKDGVNITGNLGSCDIVITAVHQASGQTIVVEKDTFVPKVGGTWKITYAVTDYVGRTGEFSYDANVEVSEGVVFGTGAVKDLNKYLIVGAKNLIPDYTYIDYNVNAEAKTVEKIYLETLAGVKAMDVVDGIVTPTTAGEYNIVYEATSAKGTTSYKKQPVTVVDVGFKSLSNFSLAKYFYSDDIASSTAARSYVTMETKANASVDFIRPLNANNASFVFQIDSSVKAAQSVIFTFTDINNAEQVIKVEILNGGKSVKVNDGSEKSLSGLSFGGSANYNVNIRAGELLIGNVSVSLTSYLNGSAFTGFDSMLVNMNIKTVNASGDNGNTKFKIYTVGNQAFYNVIPDALGEVDDLDINTPILVSNGIPSGTVLRGETITVGKSLLIDVIDPYAVGTLTVLGPDGQPMEDENGVTLDKVSLDGEYTFVAEDTGAITLRYEYEDSSNQKVDDRKLNIISRDPPIITIKKGVTTASVGKKFKVGTATVESAGGNATLYVYVLPPVGRMKEVDAKTMEFSTTVAGDYKVVYVAIDPWGNMAVQSYTVKVS